MTSDHLLPKQTCGIGRLRRAQSHEFPDSPALETYEALGAPR